MAATYFQWRQNGSFKTSLALAVRVLAVERLG